MRLTAELGQGWITYGAQEDGAKVVDAQIERLREACAAVGRDINQLELSLLAMGRARKSGRWSPSRRSSTGPGATGSSASPSSCCTGRSRTPSSPPTWTSSSGRHRGARPAHDTRLSSSRPPAWSSPPPRRPSPSRRSCPCSRSAAGSSHSATWPSSPLKISLKCVPEIAVKLRVLSGRHRRVPPEQAALEHGACSTGPCPTARARDDRGLLRPGAGQTAEGRAAHLGRRRPGPVRSLHA
jgi:hypothetical protein